MSLVVIDYKSGGNLFSLLNSLDAIDARYQVSSETSEIAKASKVIFPGVGSFTGSMTKLKELDLIEVIREKVDENCPFLGICVGMQVLFKDSENEIDYIDHFFRDWLKRKSIYEEDLKEPLFNVEIFLKHQRSLLSRDKLQEVLENIIDFTSSHGVNFNRNIKIENTATLLLASLVSLEEKHNKGIISNDEHTLERNKIRNRTQILLDKLEDEIND